MYFFRIVEQRKRPPGRYYVSMKSDSAAGNIQMDLCLVSLCNYKSDRRCASAPRRSANGLPLKLNLLLAIIISTTQSELTNDFIRKPCKKVSFSLIKTSGTLMYFVHYRCISMVPYEINEIVILINFHCPPSTRIFMTRIYLFVINWTHLGVWNFWCLLFIDIYHQKWNVLIKWSSQLFWIPTYYKVSL